MTDAVVEGGMTTVVTVVTAEEEETMIGDIVTTIAGKEGMEAEGITVTIAVEGVAGTMIGGTETQMESRCKASSHNSKVHSDNVALQV